MNKYLKIFLAILALGICYAIFVLAVGINYTYPPTKKTKQEQEIIDLWKQKGVIIDFEHYREDKNLSNLRKSIFIYCNKMAPPKREDKKDSLNFLISSIHSDFLKTLNPDYKYDSLFYMVYFDPKAPYSADTTLLYKYERHFKGH